MVADSLLFCIAKKYRVFVEVTVHASMCVLVIRRSRRTVQKTTLRAHLFFFFVYMHVTGFR